MKPFSELQTAIINQLSDGAPHSGSALGLHLKVSRTAIWKQMKLLSDFGVPIQRVPQKGYRLRTPLTLLNENCILKQLPLSPFTRPLRFHLYSSIDSTNRFLKELPPSNSIDICCAEMQTQGRGRFGRSWHSPFGENIYCSSRWHFNCDLSQLAGLSLVVSLAVWATLKEVGVEENIRIKWPNDILWHHKKLCGILIEVQAETNGSAEVIIGIGLNVNSSQSHDDTVKEIDAPINKPWCSLFDITQMYYDRNQLIASLMSQLNQHIKRFIQYGFSELINAWDPVDYLKNQQITITHPTGSLTGKANGINGTGQLILLDDQGITHYLSSGNTSLHHMQEIPLTTISDSGTI